MTIHADFTPPDSARSALARFDRILNDFVDLLGNRGALVAIDVKDLGRVSFTSGHADLERRRPVAPTDAYQIGSQTKTVVALTMILLERAGTLRLDAPVSTYIDLPIDRGITLRHLLMNASGLGEYTLGIFGPRADPRQSWRPRDLLALALPQGQVFPPGERFDYCNTGWVIAAMVIEAATGLGYGEAVSRHVLDPLGLHHSAYGGALPGGEAMHGSFRLTTSSEPIDGLPCLSWAFGAGDGVATAGDMIALFASLLDAKSPLGVSLKDLTAETKKPSASPYFPMSLGTEYGLGLERRAWAGSEVWGHPGSTGCCMTSTWIDPAEKVGVATSVTCEANLGGAAHGDLRYPRAQLFAMALTTGYALRAA
jgi:D-alanyl-D-alanine carboxypeptidase